MIAINYKDTRPIYEQVKDRLRTLIVTGVIGAQDRLPSVRELAAELAINPNTIQRAYRELEAEGYIISVPGKGSFACECLGAEREKQEELLERFDALVAQLRWMGVDNEALMRRLEGGNKGE